MLGSQELTITDIGKSVDDAASLFTDLKNVKIVNECRGFSVLADSTLTTIFYNLIDNSLKYGQKITRIKVYSEPQQKSSKICMRMMGLELILKQRSSFSLRELVKVLVMVCIL